VGPPVGVAEDQLGIGVFSGVVLWGEEAAERGLEAEELEVVSADDLSVLIFGENPTLQVRGLLPVARNAPGNQKRVE
jgi:hypothetical protein